MNCSRKRVMFSDTDADSPKNSKAPRSEEVKTSEFAFFKKLKEDASKTFASSLARNVLNQTNNFNSKNASKENINIPNNSCKEKVNTSLLVENPTPLQAVSFHSPFGSTGTRRNSDVHKKNACSTLEDILWKQKDMEEYGPNSRSDGIQCRHADTFNRKREKLRRWLTDVSFPEIDGLCSKGCDIVPVLLKRLTPECKDINIVNDQNLGREETDTKSQLVPSFESDIYSNRLQWTPRHCPELEYDPYLGDDIQPNPLWNRSRGSILLLDAPLHHDNDVHHYNYKPWASGLGELPIDRDSSFVFPIRKQISVELLEGFDKFNQPNRNLVGNQSNVHALDWHYDKEKFERTLSTICSDVEPNSHHSPLVAQLDDDHRHHYYHKPWEAGLHEGELHVDHDSNFVLPVTKHTSAEILEELDEFCQPSRNLVGCQSNVHALDWNYDKENFERALSIFSPSDIDPNSRHCSPLAAWLEDDVHINKGPEYSSPVSPSSYYQNHDLRAEILEDIHTIQDSNHLPSTISCRPNYFGPHEDFYNATGFSPQQDHWCMNKLFGQMHHYPRQRKTLQSSELVLSLGWKCFPEENHSSSYHHALEYPGESRNQIREAPHYNVFDEYESCPNESSSRGTLAQFISGIPWQQ
ncbi:hypothetical protein CsatB_024991 [Cannabis sativa]